MNSRAHGTFSVSIDNQVLLAWGKGPFNRELILDYQQAVTSAIEALAGTKWGAVISLYGESLMTPEAQQQLVAAVKDRIEKGMVATATVFLDSDATKIQHRQMSQIYQQAGAHYRLFLDEQEAIGWVRSQLPNQSGQ